MADLQKKSSNGKNTPPFVYHGHCGGGGCSRRLSGGKEVMAVVSRCCRWRRGDCWRCGSHVVIVSVGGSVGVGGRVIIAVDDVGGRGFAIMVKGGVECRILDGRSRVIIVIRQ